MSNDMFTKQEDVVIKVSIELMIASFILLLVSGIAFIFTDKVIGIILLVSSVIVPIIILVISYAIVRNSWYRR